MNDRIKRLLDEIEHNQVALLEARRSECVALPWLPYDERGERAW